MNFTVDFSVDLFINEMSKFKEKIRTKQQQQNPQHPNHWSARESARTRQFMRNSTSSSGDLQLAGGRPATCKDFARSWPGAGQELGGKWLGTSWELAEGWLGTGQELAGTWPAAGQE